MAHLSKKLRGVACLLYALRAYLPFAIRRLIAQSLGYSLLRYGMCCFFNCSATWKNRINRILKNMAKSVIYSIPHKQQSVFLSSGLPSFDIVFKQITVLRYFWNSDFRFHNVKPIPLRKVSRYIVPAVRTHFGMSMRSYYIPCIFNEMPDNVFNLNTRRQLRDAIAELEQL